MLDSAALRKKVAALCLPGLIALSCYFCFYLHGNRHGPTLLLGVRVTVCLVFLAFTEITMDPPCLRGIRVKISYKLNERVTHANKSR